MTLETLSKLRNELLNILVIEDRGRKLPFFEMNSRLEVKSDDGQRYIDYFETMKTISLNDIFEFAEKRKLITIHRENFK